MKQCFKCQRQKPRSEFYAHPQMGDRLFGKCKDCTRKDANERRIMKQSDPAWVAAETERQRTKNRLMNHRTPEIASARRAVRALGRSMEFHWHHWSYLREHRLDVIKLTPKDHRTAHRHMVYDPERMQYRRASDMVLLDTREAHELFLKSHFGIIAL